MLAIYSFPLGDDTIAIVPYLSRRPSSRWTRF